MADKLLEALGGEAGVERSTLITYDEPIPVRGAQVGTYHTKVRRRGGAKVESKTLYRKARAEYIGPHFSDWTEYSLADPQSL